MDDECLFLSAIKWRAETQSLLCSSGKVILPIMEEPLVKSELNEKKLRDVSVF